MANGFRASAHVARSVEEVWAELTDWARAPEWMAGIADMRPDGGGPVGEGSVLTFRSRGAERTTTVVEWSPPSRLSLRSTQGGMSATYTYACAPERDGTRLTLDAACEARGLHWQLMSPVIGYLMKRSDSGQVAALKRMIEGAG